MLKAVELLRETKIEDRSMGAIAKSYESIRSMFNNVASSVAIPILSVPGFEVSESMNVTNNYSVNMYIDKMVADEKGAEKVLGRIVNLQAKLADLLNLNLGRKYTLPQYNAINFPEKHLNDETFKNVFLFQTIKIDRNFMLVDLIRTEGLKLDFYYSNNYLFSPINILGLFATYRMDFYYFLFENIERHEINEIINKYFLNTSKRIKYRDYKWLINKMRSLNDNKLLGNYSESSVLVKEWKAYINGEETPLYFVSGKYTEKYNIIYSESLDHIRMAYSIQKENLVIYLASGSLIASLIGVILTLILK